MSGNVAFHHRYHFRLAIGCGDHTIRVWNLGADAAYSTVTVWQGLKAKVLTVSSWRDVDVFLVGCLFVVCSSTYDNIVMNVVVAMVLELPPTTDHPPPTTDR